MCLVCDRIERIRRGENPDFVRELETGYVVIAIISSSSAMRCSCAGGMWRSCMSWNRSSGRST